MSTARNAGALSEVLECGLKSSVLIRSCCGCCAQVAKWAIRVHWWKSTVALLWMLKTHRWECRQHGEYLVVCARPSLIGGGRNGGCDVFLASPAPLPCPP
eukprot:36846-Pelagomonas_calceolata.AAC.1